MQTNRSLFESYDENYYKKIFFDEDSNGFVVAHKEHGPYELKGNKTIALMLVKHGYRVVLLGNEPEVTSADATLNDEIWEFKTISEATNLRNRVQGDIKNGKRQAPNILIFINQVYVAREITKGIYNAIKFDVKKTAQRIGILFQDGSLIIIERAEVLDKSYRDKFIPL
jgi:Contact-dependent growth inhibition CdiA C-terminal domain